MEADCPERRAPASALAEGLHVEYPSRPDLAIAAVIQLMSRYPATHKAAVAQSIVGHLRAIGGDERLPVELRECARGLVGDWQRYAVLSGDGAALPSRRPC